jgi:hypothetical protein
VAQRVLYVRAAGRRPDEVCVTLQTDVGLVVRPKRYRAVLMDQDVLHRVSAPSAAAGGRPRYSLVWKLVSSALVTYVPCYIHDIHVFSLCEVLEISCQQASCLLAVALQTLMVFFAVSFVMFDYQLLCIQRGRYNVNALNAYWLDEGTFLPSTMLICSGSCSDSHRPISSSSRQA